MQTKKIIPDKLKRARPYPWNMIGQSKLPSSFLSCKRVVQNPLKMPRFRSNKQRHYNDHDIEILPVPSEKG